MGAENDEPWSVQDLHPELVGEWDAEANAPLTPGTVSFGSGFYVWWCCPHGHRWRARVGSRTSGGHGCPYCAGRRTSEENSLATRFPEVAAEWDVDANVGLSPAEVTYGSGRRVAWRCGRGHSWVAPVFRRTSGRRSGCPYCAGRRGTG